MKKKNLIQKCSWGMELNSSASIMCAHGSRINVSKKRKKDEVFIAHIVYTDVEHFGLLGEPSVPCHGKSRKGEPVQVWVRERETEEREPGNGEEERVEDSGTATRGDEGEIGMVFEECHVIIGRHSTVPFDDKRRHLSVRLGLARFVLGSPQLSSTVATVKRTRCWHILVLSSS